ncbi:MAG TPA: type I-U CRISPR-associated RAMP protein Csb1/Cas7u [Kofleriaceae bacterium]|jgi:CRISPR-associated protein Csb1
MKKLDLEQLSSLVNGDGVAFRVQQRLQPAGGPGDKVFPPTYATGDRNLKYAVERRRIDGRDVETVLLDSVASQANRMEEALLEAWTREQLLFPIVGVDFTTEKELADLGSITTLQAPHRIADAILRDATTADGKAFFRETPEGKAYTAATPRNATAVYLLCPTALVFGVWDSTGPKGGLGAKFQRALTSEIVGIDAVTGSKVGSRLDPLAIVRGVPVYQDKDDRHGWTIDPEEAKGGAAKPQLFSGEGKGTPAAINHSNIPPSIDAASGGVTFDHALQTVVLSLPALRRLRFVTGLDGKALAKRDAAERAARVSLAALALAGIVHQRAQGYDLRSRCLLVPDSGLVLEILRADGASEQIALGTDDVDALVAAAGKAAEAAGLGWVREPLKLRPAPKLVALVKASRGLAAAGTDKD